MRKALMIAAVLLCGGCAVEAEEITDTYTGTVIENDGETAVVQFDEWEETETEVIDETDTQKTDTDRKVTQNQMGDTMDDEKMRFSFHRKDEMIILDDSCTVGFDELKKDNQVVVTFSKHKAVIRLIEDNEPAE